MGGLFDQKKNPIEVSFSVCSHRVHVNVGTVTLHLDKADFIHLVHSANGVLGRMAQDGLLDADQKRQIARSSTTAPIVH